MGSLEGGDSLNAGGNSFSVGEGIERGGRVGGGGRLVVIKGGGLVGGGGGGRVGGGGGRLVGGGGGGLVVGGGGGGLVGGGGGGRVGGGGGGLVGGGGGGLVGGGVGASVNWLNLAGGGCVGAGASSSSRLPSRNCRIRFWLDLLLIRISRIILAASSSSVISLCSLTFKGCCEDCWGGCWS